MATLYNWSKYNNRTVPHSSTSSKIGSHTDGACGTYSNGLLVSGWSPGQGASSYYYNDGTYSGNIPYTGASQTSNTNNGDGTTTTCWSRYWSGTVYSTYTYYTDAEGSLVSTSFDTVDAHTDGVKNADGYWYERGSVYNYDPTVSLKDNNGTIITSNLQIPHNDKSDFKFNIVGNDQDTNDTIQYKVQLNGVDHSSYISTLKGITKSYTIPFSDLTLGNNTVTVYMKDSKGYSVTQSFILRNKVPQHFSLHSVLDSETALGYGNTSFTDLQDIMPSGYSGTLSMADFIDYLS